MPDDSPTPEKPGSDELKEFTKETRFDELLLASPEDLKDRFDSPAGVANRLGGLVTEVGGSDEWKEEYIEAVDIENVDADAPSEERLAEVQQGAREMVGDVVPVDELQELDGVSAAPPENNRGATGASKLGPPDQQRYDGSRSVEEWRKVFDLGKNKTVDTRVMEHVHGEGIDPDDLRSVVGLSKDGTIPKELVEFVEGDDIEPSEVREALDQWGGAREQSGPEMR